MVIAINELLLVHLSLSTASVSLDPSSSDRKAIREEARIVERAIGIGPSALTGMVAMLQQNRDIKSA